MLLRKDLISLPAVVVAYAQLLACEISEAADLTIDIICENRRYMPIYDGKADGLIQEYDDSNDSGFYSEIFNSKWWRGKRQYKSNVSPFDMLILRSDAIKFFRLSKQINELDRSFFEIDENKVGDLNDSLEFILNVKNQNFTATNEYSTVLMDILKLAVNEFFNPRKIVDPKKEEVTEWIKSKGMELGVNVSSHVAKSIFTLIKPNDHNPKIKKVLTHNSNKTVHSNKG